MLIHSGPECGSVLLTANAGVSGASRGGDGYSGGAAPGTVRDADGGSNGGDGQDSSDSAGGQGSGFDISIINLQNIVLR